MRFFHKQPAFKRLALILLGLSSVWVITPVQARNLGVEGAVYEIVEPDMLESIHHRLLALKESGGLDQKKKEMVKNSLKHLMRPKSVVGVSHLPAGTEPLIHDMDPSIVVKEDILDAEGQVIARKGQKVNPLSYMDFTETLLFIDGDDPAQMSWIHQLVDQNQEEGRRLKIILVRGNVRLTSDALHHRVYFDQQGALCQRLHIKHSPARVYQPLNSLKIRVEEVSVD